MTSKVLLDNAEKVIGDPHQAGEVPKDDLDLLLRSGPIGMVVIERARSDMNGRLVVNVAWRIQTVGGDKDSWNREAEVLSVPVPASCDTDEAQEEVDAGALKLAIDSSRRMSLLSKQMADAVSSPAPYPPADAYGALLFAGLPYIHDPETPTWSRWVTSSADIASTATSFGALLWSVKLRNDFSDGRSTSLSGANTAFWVGVGAAIGVAAIRLASGAYYYFKYERGR